MLLQHSLSGFPLLSLMLYYECQYECQLVLSNFINVIQYAYVMSNTYLCHR